MIPSNASHCGSSTTMGHGDFAICGQPYYDGIYQCNGCQIKALKAIIGRCHEAIGENAGSDDDTLPESIAMHVMQRSERIAELEAAASARSETLHRWIPVKDRVPSEADADETGCVLMSHPHFKGVSTRHWKTVNAYATDPDDNSMIEASWMRLPEKP